jgi:hypothetical protein
MKVHNADGGRAGRARVTDVHLGRGPREITDLLHMALAQLLPLNRANDLMIPFLYFKIQRIYFIFSFYF